jgi:restriction system protein
MTKRAPGAPQFVRFFGPVLDALHQLGGSGRPDEVRSVIAQKLGLTEKEQSEPLPSKAQPRFHNQVHWARFYLSKAGFLDSSRRGVWALTEKGRTALPLTEAIARVIFREVSATFAKSKIKPQDAGSKQGDEEVIPEADAAVIQQTYRDEVVTKLPVAIASWILSGFANAYCESRDSRRSA